MALPFTRTDENRLRQVFWNIVSNALKFTPEGGAVSLTTRFDGTHAVVEIADTGIGIAASFLPHVFDKFRQEDGTHTREHSGLGLGLAITRQFVELHDGTISAASAGRGHGSSFVVRIPASRPATLPALPEASGNDAVPAWSAAGRCKVAAAPVDAAVAVASEPSRRSAPRAGSPSRKSAPRTRRS
jgi:hypothetical protein